MNFYALALVLVALVFPQWLRVRVLGRAPVFLSIIVLLRMRFAAKLQLDISVRIGTRRLSFTKFHHFSDILNYEINHHVVLI